MFQPPRQRYLTVTSRIKPKTQHYITPILYKAPPKQSYLTTKTLPSVKPISTNSDSLELIGDDSDVGDSELYFDSANDWPDVPNEFQFVPPTTLPPPPPPLPPPPPTHTAQSVKSEKSLKSNVAFEQTLPFNDADLLNGAKKLKKRDPVNSRKTSTSTGLPFTDKDLLKGAKNLKKIEQAKTKEYVEADDMTSVLKRALNAKFENLREREVFVDAQEPEQDFSEVLNDIKYSKLKPATVIKSENNANNTTWLDEINSRKRQPLKQEGGSGVRQSKRLRLKKQQQ